jgi:hypothetical protein
MTLVPLINRLEIHLNVFPPNFWSAPSARTLESNITSRNAQQQALFWECQVQAFGRKLLEREKKRLPYPAFPKSSCTDERNAQAVRRVLAAGKGTSCCASVFS